MRASATHEELQGFLGSYHEAGASPPEPVTDELATLATRVSADPGQVLTRQFAPADAFYVLVDGEVRFQIQLEHGNEDLDEIGRASCRERV